MFFNRIQQLDLHFKSFPVHSPEILFLGSLLD
jgi:hypothetical protein